VGYHAPVHSLHLSVVPGVYAICGFPAGAPVPSWAEHTTALLSITRTPDELSIVCEAALVPPEVQAERGWSCLGVRGPLDFALVGVLAAIVQPLANAGVSVFATSTYNTDYVLVRASSLEQTITAMERAGHQVAR
jgi:uncharacterized protein